jgi:hypothetical protein
LDYQSRKATRDAPVIERMKALAAQYPRFGYRRIGSGLDADVGQHRLHGRRRTEVTECAWDRDTIRVRDTHKSFAIELIEDQHGFLTESRSGIAPVALIAGACSLQGRPATIPVLHVSLPDRSQMAN